MHQYNLSIRRVTRVGQMLLGHLLEVRNDFTAAINKRFLEGGTLQNVDPKFILNMDQTAIYFEQKSTRVIARKGVKSVPICSSNGIQ